MANKHLTALLKLPGAVAPVNDFEVFAQGVRHPSPSFNFILGNTHLIPFGASAIFWGPPKGGKSVILNGMIGQLHRDYPDAIAIRFNTEGRELLQTTPLQKKIWGIDSERFVPIETNRPAEIFDTIEHEVPKLVQNGANIRLIIIDSISDIMGRRSLNADGIDTQQMGDEALTLKDGLKRIKFIYKRLGISLLLVAQERAELDPMEQRKHRTTKMHGAAYLKHLAEYFIHVRKNDTADGRKDIDGNPLTSDLSDMNDNNKEQMGHKIVVKMQDSTIGPKNRIGEFTLHYYKGLINDHEEVFTLAVNRKLVERPNLRTYVLKDFPQKGEEAKWGSSGDFIAAIKNNDQLKADIISRLKERDIALMKEGKLADEPEEPVTDTSEDPI
jgi:hypothetical protein